VTEETSITFGVDVATPVMTVTRDIGLVDSTPTEYIQSIVLTQEVSVSPRFTGGVLTWTWTPSSDAEWTDDVDTALGNLGWGSTPPNLDPTLTYTLTIAES
jgi:hypothetical protein